MSARSSLLENYLDYLHEGGSLNSIKLTSHSTRRSTLVNPTYRDVVSDIRRISRAPSHGSAAWSRCSRIAAASVRFYRIRFYSARFSRTPCFIASDPVIASFFNSETPRPRLSFASRSGHDVINGNAHISAFLRSRRGRDDIQDYVVPSAEIYSESSSSSLGTSRLRGTILLYGWPFIRTIFWTKRRGSARCARATSYRNCERRALSCGIARGRRNSGSLHSTAGAPGITDPAGFPG